MNAQQTFADPTIIEAFIDELKKNITKLKKKNI